MRNLIKHAATLFAIVSAISIAPAVAAGPTTGIAARLEALFPAVTAYVVDVRGNELYIGAGRENGLTVGAVVGVARQGRRIVDPTTGKDLGSEKRFLGALVLDSVTERFSIGHLAATRARAPVAKGDLVEPLETPVRFTIVSDPTQTVAAIRLAGALSGSARLRATDAADLAAFLARRRLTDRNALLGVPPDEFRQARLAIDVFLRPTLRMVAGREVLSVTPRLVAAGVDLSPVNAMLPASTASPAPPALPSQPASPAHPATGSPHVLPPGESRASAYETPDLDVSNFADPAHWRRIEGVPRALRAVAVGDLDGDGRDDIVTADRGSVFLFKINGSRVVEKTRFDVETDGDIVALDAFDVNGDGRAEVIVSTTDGDGARALVLELEDGRLRSVLTVARVLFRVVGGYLLGQRWDDFTSGNGRLAVYGFDGQTLVADTPVTVPEGIGVLQIGGADIERLLAVDRRQRIVGLDRNGAVRWRSKQSCCQSNTGRDERLPGVVATPIVRYNGGLLVAENEPNVKFLGLKSGGYGNGGKIVAMRWSRAGEIVRAFDGVQFSGWIAGYAVGDIDHDGSNDVIGIQAPSALEFGGSYLLLYR